ncbi:MAG: sodium:solute symporter [Rhizobacter sp.]|nr:sodium:solute symporter [Chlorobiales bacterium]
MTTSFTLLDWFIVLLYVGGVTLFGIIKGGRQTSAKDYFLSETKIRWWVVAFAVVATETSALTFISVPGLAYLGNLNFLQLAFGYLLGRIFIAIYFLPRYYAGELTTAYAMIERRFGTRLRKLTSLVFMVTRTLGDGVRLYALAIPITLIFRGYNLFSGSSDTEIYFWAILLTSAATVIYVQLGGVRAVIWTDVIQLFVYLFGAAVAIVILIQHAPSFSAAFQPAMDKGKLAVFNFSTENFFSSPYQFFLAVIGGAFLSAASHGTDYLIVQRLFATENLKDSQRAIVASGVLIIVQFAIFLCVGLLLYGFYQGAAIKGDEVFARFIIEQVPSGFSGLIVAALIAAAMSSHSGSVNSLASSTVFDFYASTTSGKAASEAKKLKIAKAVSLAWAIVLTVSALLFIGLGRSVVEVALSIASFTYGGLLGVFLLAVFFKSIDETSVIIGFFIGIAVMIGVITQTKIAWTLYTVIGSTATILFAVLASRFQMRKAGI